MTHLTWHGRDRDLAPRRALLAGAAFGVALILFSGCESARTPAPRAHHVDIRAMRFEPAVLHVAVGDTVRWTNSDLVPHTVTSQAGVLDSGNLPPDSSWAVVVAGRGVLEYSCLYHTGMKGSIVAESMTRLRPRSGRDPANASVGAAEQFTKRNSR